MRGFGCLQLCYTRYSATHVILSQLFLDVTRKCNAGSERQDLADVFCYLHASTQDKNAHQSLTFTSSFAQSHNSDYN